MTDLGKEKKKSFKKEKRGFGIHDQRTRDCVISCLSNIRVDYRRLGYFPEPCTSKSTDLGKKDLRIEGKV